MRTDGVTTATPSASALKRLLRFAVALLVLGGLTSALAIESQAREVSSQPNLRTFLDEHGTFDPHIGREKIDLRADRESPDSLASGPSSTIEEVPPFARVDAITLEPGEDELSSAVIDPAGEYAYFGTTAGVVKVDLATFERVDMLPASSARAGVMDSMGEYAYFGLPWWQPGRLLKIDLDTFEQVDELDLQLGERGFSAAVVDADGRYAYFGTSGPSGSVARVIKIDLGTFERVGSLPLWGRERVDSAVIDPAGEFAYFGTGPGFAQVIKVELETFEQVELISLDGEYWLHAAAMDPAGQYAYFGSDSTATPSRVVKIDLDVFEQVDAIDPAEGGFRSAVIDPAGAYAYFAAADDARGQVVKIDVDTFERVDVITLEPGERYLNSAVVDPAGEFAYFGDVVADPGLVVKVRIGTGNLGSYVPLVPERVLDTRDDTGQVEGKVGAGQTVSQQVAGVGSVPADASAVAVNVTAADPTAASHLRVWPTGEPIPLASTINFQPGVNIANMVIVEVGTDGSIDLYNHNGEVEIILDVVGYFPADGLP